MLRFLTVLRLALDSNLIFEIGFVILETFTGKFIPTILISHALVWNNPSKIGG